MQNRTPKTILPGMPVSSPRRPRPRGAEAAWRTARGIAATFALLVSFVMLFGHLSSDALDPLKSPDLKALKEQLRLNPTDEQLKKRIRESDLELRASYFRRLSHSASGSWLLFGGIAVFIFTATQCARYRKQLPLPKPRLAADPAQAARIARWSVGAAGAVIGGSLLLLSLGGGAALSEPAGPTASVGAPAAGAGSSVPDAASVEELRRNWPRFRGAGGNGVAAATNLPPNWETKTGSGVAWKTPVPAPGFNSPIVWGDRLFFSGGDSAKLEVFCFSCGTGQMLWRQAVANVPGSPAQAPEIPETTGYAAST